MFNDKIHIFLDDVNEKGIIPSITHRLYKREQTRKVISPFINKIKPRKVLINNLTYFLDPNDQVVSECLAFSKKWSPKETEIIKTNLKQGDTFVDVGAHIGYFTVLAADLVGPQGHVYALEPNPQSFKFLKKNIRTNRFKNVTLINKAVTNRVGSLTLYINKQNTGDTRISKPDFKFKKVKVKTTTLDRELKGKSVDFIKIDIQGAEPFVLRGIKNVLYNNKNLKLLIEFWPEGIKKLNNDPIEFYNKLKQCFKSIKKIGSDSNLFCTN